MSDLSSLKRGDRVLIVSVRYSPGEPAGRKATVKSVGRRWIMVKNDSRRFDRETGREAEYGDATLYTPEGWADTRERLALYHLFKSRAPHSLSTDQLRRIVAIMREA